MSHLREFVAHSRVCAKMCTSMCEEKDFPFLYNFRKGARRILVEFYLSFELLAFPRREIGKLAVHDM